MRDGDLVEEMITSTVMDRFFHLGEYFLPLQAGNLGKMILHLARSLL